MADAEYPAELPPVSPAQQRLETQAFLGMKFAETICCLACVIVHVQGFLYHAEPIPHELLFCGLYTSYLLISGYGFLFLYLGCYGVNYAAESVVSLVAFALFNVSAFVSMYHAEQDLHIQYLSDEEEWFHRFFEHCRSQSLAATVTGQIFLIHGALAMDLDGTLRRWFRSIGVVSVASIASTRSAQDQAASERLLLNPFWIPCWHSVVRWLTCKPSAAD